MAKVDTISDLAKLFLPDLLVKYFDLLNHEFKSDSHHFYYAEKNRSPLEKPLKVHSKGYYKQGIVQDFPIRGKSVYLYIKRRKWIEIGRGKTIKRDWSLVETGTRITSKFTAFLKELY